MTSAFGDEQHVASYSDIMETVFENWDSMDHRAGDFPGLMRSQGDCSIAPPIQITIIVAITNV